MVPVFARRMMAFIMTVVIAGTCSGVLTIESAVAADGTIVTKRIRERTGKYRMWSIAYMSEGMRVRGILIEPVSGGVEKRRPAVVFNHGGVDGIPSPLLKRGKELVEEGYVVFAPSYRGEDGSDGEVEVAAGEVDDVLNAVKMLRAMPGVDADRISMIGASHGGIITLLAIERENSLAAAVCAYGVANTYTWYGHLVENGFDVSDPLSIKVYGKGPEDKPEAFRSRAPALDASSINTPLLLLYGEKDTTVPVSQGSEMAAALEAGKKRYKFRVIPDVGHGFLFFTDPARRSTLEIKRSSEAWAMVKSFLKEHPASR